MTNMTNQMMADFGGFFTFLLRNASSLNQCRYRWEGWRVRWVVATASEKMLNDRV